MIKKITNVRRILILASILVNLSFIESGSGNYVLTAKTERVYSEGSQKYLVTIVRLTNNTSDTLKYLSWSCSYWQFYQLKSATLTWGDRKCLKNLPWVKKLAPHQSDSVRLTFKVKAGNTDPVTYKVGMELAKDEGHNLANEFLHKPMKSVIIWTEEVSGPN